MEDYTKRAEDFLKNEKQFHLGMLETEKPHPLTKDFTGTLKKDVPEGVRAFLSVDRDIVEKSEHVFQSAEYAELVSSIVQAAFDNHAIVFSGCGSTGRLGVLLETMWRGFWLQAAKSNFEKSNSENRQKWQARAERTCSIITGGELALIRSVENFEDYQSFGRRQAQEAGISKGDLFLGITEGGETSSVIGSVWQAREQGAKTFFIFNNPAEILAANIHRSKEILECTDIVSMELATGPMALAGSTRLQATTIGLLVIGAALEEAIIQLLEKEDKASHLYWKNRISKDYTGGFRNLLNDLDKTDNTAMIARFAMIEADIYSRSGLVTYFADEYLLDIFSDTTERTPTFKLPPFQPLDAASGAASWAFAKGLLYDTKEQWHRMLHRAPRGLLWEEHDYTALGGPGKCIENPPKLGLDEIYRYPIGTESDPGRHSSDRDAAIFFYAETSENRDYIEKLHQAFLCAGQPNMLHVSLNSSKPMQSGMNFHLTLNESPLSLMTHLAVKLIFNTMSNTCMGLMGRIRGNWMIQVDATNKKLIDRSIRLISSLGNLGYDQSCVEFFKTLSMAPNGANESIVERTLRRL